MNLYDVVKAPLLSEKSNELRESQGQYTFLVDRQANKLEIRKAFEKFFNVNVVKVTTAITRGKYRRRGAHVALGKARKKATVTLSKGQKLDLFEDQ